MSTERKCFKLMATLIEEHRDYQQRYYETGRELVRQAVVEFMDDHPEVSTLQLSPHNPITLRVELDDRDKYFEYKDLIESNPKLAVCLGAMVSHFSALGGVVRSIFLDDVRITHENIRAVVG